jgi:hypothetical protein
LRSSISAPSPAPDSRDQLSFRAYSERFQRFESRATLVSSPASQDTIYTKTFPKPGVNSYLRSISLSHNYSQTSSDLAPTNFPSPRPCQDHCRTPVTQFLVTLSIVALHGSNNIINLVHFLLFLLKFTS